MFGPPLKIRKAVCLISAQKTEKKSSLAEVAFKDFCITTVGFPLNPLIFGDVCSRLMNKSGTGEV